jgi:hypothetical protein
VAQPIIAHELNHFGATSLPRSRFLLAWVGNTWRDPHNHAANSITQKSGQTAMLPLREPLHYDFSKTNLVNCRLLNPGVCNHEIN